MRGLFSKQKSYLFFVCLRSMLSPRGRQLFGIREEQRSNESNRTEQTREHKKKRRERGITDNVKRRRRGAEKRHKATPRTKTNRIEKEQEKPILSGF